MMDSRQIILQAKYARIIAGIAQRLGVSLDEAMDRFFHSVTFTMIDKGVADLHCRSDIYLVDEFCLEVGEKTDAHAASADAKDANNS